MSNKQWLSSGFRIVPPNSTDQEIFLVPEERELAEALVRIANKYGKFNQDGTGIWAGYDSPDENEVKDIGVKCSNCALYVSVGNCRIIDFEVQPEGKCRFAVIPDGTVNLDKNS